ncbi:phosphoribosylaminoimidazolesuccinocarboxamide synthase [Paenibacillus polymyxa]|uniref:phosphoribosylaminoimidazolesuccinocarboxamide synthase n=1 Tax=Paenibacillus polymyxa TaxID=1406 RepID=UPI00307F3C85
MNKANMLYACGKSKSMYYGENQNEIVMHFLDSVSSYTQNKNARILGTGIVRCEVSSVLFDLLNKNGIPTHYKKNIGEGKMLVEKLEMIKLEVIPRNYAAGSIVRNFPVQYGQKFEPPLLKLDLKYNNDPMLNDDYIVALGIASNKELKVIKDLAHELNSFLTLFLKQRDIQLVDFKFEVGRRQDGTIVIGDEISPDGMRMWDVHTLESLDKDVFRFDKGDLVEAYKEVARRILL